MIYWINFVLYLIMISVELLMHTLLLTPKYPNGKSIILFILAGQITGIIKFFVPIGSIYELAITLINTPFAIILGYILFKEKLKGNLIAIGITDMTVTFFSLLNTIAVPEIMTAEIDTLGSTVLYSSSIIMFSALVPVVIKIKRIWDKMHINMASAAAVIIFIILNGIYYIIMTQLVVWFFEKTYLNYRIFIVMIAAVSVIAMVLMAYLLFLREEEDQQTERLRELEIAWKSERENYDTLLSEMGQIERIRHDFYGQLAAARHIMTLDRVRGIAMIEELRGNLAQKKTGEKTQ